MNKIEVVGDSKDTAISVERTDAFTKIKVIEDCTLQIEQEEVELPIEITVLEHCTLHLQYLGKDTAQQLSFHLKEKSRLIVHQVVLDSSDIVEVSFDGVDAECEYHSSLINTKANQIKMNLYHNCSHTKSNVFYHGVNQSKEALQIEVNGIIPKQSTNCICNQENQIISLVESDSSIHPNLWIENNEVEASHSAYIGTLKEKEIFYLMTRGISRKESELLLLKGFLFGGFALEEKKINEWLS